MKKKLIYIAGKVTGLPASVAAENFEKMAVALGQRGYVVFNPFMHIENLNRERRREGLLPLCDSIQTDRNKIMRICIHHLTQADEVHTLPNWTDSRGAWMEVDIAHRLGIPVIHHKQ